MSDTTSGRGQPALISVSLLAILAAGSLAFCCYAASFLLAKSDITAMQQAGFYCWTSSAGWDGRFNNVLSAAVPSVWFSYLPGQKLALVLVPAPAYAATRSALAVLLAGLALVPVILLYNRNRWFVREAFMLLSALALCAAVFLFTPLPPNGFTIDLKQQLVTVNGSASGAQIEITQHMNIDIIAAPESPLLGHYLVPGYNLVIENNHYGSLMIAQGTQDALITACNLAMTFINTQGNQV